MNLKHVQSWKKRLEVDPTIFLDFASFWKCLHFPKIAFVSVYSMLKYPLISEKRAAAMDSLVLKSRRPNSGVKTYHTIGKKTYFLIADCQTHSRPRFVTLLTTFQWPVNDLQWPVNDLNDLVNLVYNSVGTQKYFQKNILCISYDKHKFYGSWYAPGDVITHPRISGHWQVIEGHWRELCGACNYRRKVQKKSRNKKNIFFIHSHGMSLLLS